MLINCLFAALWWRIWYGGKIITRRSCGGNFLHFLHQSPDGTIRQFVPLVYEKRKFPRLFFKGRVIYGDYHGLCHRVLLDIGYTHEQIDGWQPEQLIAEFERVRNKINGDF